jgi:HEAT repeat protein
MLVQSRARWLSFIGLAIGALALAPGGRLAAQTTQTRQVSVESPIYDLKSPDPVRRQAAARELGKVKHQPAIPDLIALAHDPVPDVRREVESALEHMEDIRALPGFVAFATDTEVDIRSHAVASLVNIHLPRTKGLGAALSKLGEMIMLTPERDLDLIVEPDVPVDPIVITTLTARISDSDKGIRRTAIRGVGILRGQAAIPELVRVVREDRDDSLRFDGVRSLRKIADASVGADLVALLNINDDAVRNEMMATLGSMRYRGAVPELTRIVDSATKTDTPRVVALAALADIADPSSAPLFERLKADKYEPLRLYANEGIARTASADSKTAISAARLIEKSAWVRTAQAFALARIGELEYLDELVRALDRPLTRDLAREYLLETPPANRQALFTPRDASPGARAELAEILGRIGDPDALPRLQQLSNDTDADVARAAERATRRITVTSSSSSQ